MVRELLATYNVRLLEEVAKGLRERGYTDIELSTVFGPLMIVATREIDGALVAMPPEPVKSGLYLMRQIEDSDCVQIEGLATRLECTVEDRRV